jgi:tRNA modification GTPase
LSVADPGGARWRQSTPAGVAGALAAIELVGDVDEALSAAGIGAVGVGRVSLRDLCGVDRGLVARWSRGLAHLMPHGGVAVTRAIGAALTRAGIEPAEPAPEYPEARTRLEGRMLAALARAASPSAIDLILAQPALWARAGLDPDADPATLEFDAALEAARARLIDPPLVVAVGASNIGKSTLVNRLAGRSVSIVADEPGTTRDHVGVQLDLAGVVVRWVDTPGIRQGVAAAEREAAALARAVEARADLLILCGDPRTPPPDRERGLRVCLRRDLGAALWPAEVEVSAVTGAGMTELVSRVREALVPSAALRDPRPWSVPRRDGA